MIISGRRMRTNRMAPTHGGASVSMHMPLEETSSVSAAHSGADSAGVDLTDAAN